MIAWSVVLSDTVQIRRAETDDALVISRLMMSLGYDHSVEEIARRWSLVDDHTANPVLLALRGKHAKGLLALHISPLLFYPQPIARITTLVVERDSRRLGIGRALVNEALRIASEAGCKTLELTTGAQREDAHQFYERLGFVSLALKMERRVDER